MAKRGKTGKQTPIKVLDPVGAKPDYRRYMEARGFESMIHTALTDAPIPAWQTYKAGAENEASKEGVALNPSEASAAYDRGVARGRRNYRR